MSPAWAKALACQAKASLELMGYQVSSVTVETPPTTEGRVEISVTEYVERERVRLDNLGARLGGSCRWQRPLTPSAWVPEPSSSTSTGAS